MKIAILGAGWFGCHLALELNKLNNSITLIEKKNDIFLGMSGFNSNRLHLGFHYPRANKTRMQCKESYLKFIKKYPKLVSNINRNLIGIHDNSILNFNQYIKILEETKLNYSIHKNLFNIRNVQGFIKCDEKLIDPFKSKNFFKKKLTSINTYFNYKIRKFESKNNKIKINNDSYDWIIDCTGCNFLNKYKFPIIYEPRITLIYKTKLNSTAIMIMDGLFWSIYPLKNNFVTVGSVIHSRLSKGKKNYLEANKIIKNINSKKINLIIKNFEDQILNDFVDFKKYYKYHSYYFSIATIENSKNDERTLMIDKKRNYISLLGGKIDTIIKAEEDVKKLIYA